MLLFSSSPKNLLADDLTMTSGEVRLMNLSESVRAQMGGFVSGEVRQMRLPLEHRQLSAGVPTG
jgi:hypothetical protein